MLGATGILVGAFFLESVHIQEVLGGSALHTGLAFLPFVAATALGVHGSSHAIGKVGSRALIARRAVDRGGGRAGARHRARPRLRTCRRCCRASSYSVSGMGLAFLATSVTTMGDVDHETAGLASGVMRTAHEVGAALGTAGCCRRSQSASSSAGFAGSAFVAAAVIAGALALAAATVAPGGAGRSRERG